MRVGLVEAARGLGDKTVGETLDGRDFCKHSCCAPSVERGPVKLVGERREVFADHCDGVEHRNILYEQMCVYKEKHAY